MPILPKDGHQILMQITMILKGIKDGGRNSYYAIWLFIEPLVEVWKEKHESWAKKAGTPYEIDKPTYFLTGKKIRLFLIYM